ncbi:hypothetical protein GOP47_0002591 [Adiantum capillus-veneris]|uniref:TOG domain-containing protein n=1 Tax=Adiantum capillus-veneris TaxID=13818 RepID=A0A9D4VC29_ADICA|nr:hypothetical protein GOP47_0002591 [Adiantum capillus-veneris]
MVQLCLLNGEDDHSPWEHLQPPLRRRAVEPSLPPPAARVLPYTVVFSSGQDENFPASELNKGALGRGWQSPRFCTYPQEIIIELECQSKIASLQLLSHEYKIASKVEVFASSESPWGGKESLKQMKQLGFVSLDPNDKTKHQARELKHISIDCQAILVRLLLHTCFLNKMNAYNQVGIIALIVTGEPLAEQCMKEPLAKSPSVKCTRDFECKGHIPTPSKMNSTLNNGADDALNEVDSRTTQEILVLRKEKSKAVQIENYDEAKRLKHLIEHMLIVGVQIKALEHQKQAAVQEEDYDTAKSCKLQIEKIRESCKSDFKIDRKTQTISQLSEQENHDSVQFPKEGLTEWEMAQEDPTTANEHWKNLDIELGNSHGDSEFQDVEINILPSHEAPPVDQQSQYTSDTKQTEEMQASPLYHHHVHDLPSSSLRHGGGVVSGNKQKSVKDEDSPLSHDRWAVGHSPREFQDASTQTQECQKPDNQDSNEMDPLQHQDEETTKLSPYQMGSTRRESAESSLEEDPGASLEDNLLPEPLAEAIVKELEPILILIDPFYLDCLYSRHWQLRDKGLQHMGKQLQSQGVTEPISTIRATVKVLTRALNDKVSNVFQTSLQVLRLFVERYCTERPSKELHSSLNSIIVVLLEKLGHSNVRIKESATETFLFLAMTKEIGLNLLAPYLLKPPKSQATWKPILGRLQLLFIAIPMFGLQSHSQAGFPVEALMAFIIQSFGSPNGEVRNAAVKATVEAYRLMGPPLEKFLKGVKPAIHEVLIEKFEKVSNSLSSVASDPVIKSQRSNKDDQEKEKHPERLEVPNEHDDVHDQDNSLAELSEPLQKKPTVITKMPIKILSKRKTESKVQQSPHHDKPFQF